MVVLLGLQQSHQQFFILQSTFKHSIKEIVGEQIKWQRIKKGISQQQLADLLEVDRQYVWKIENGRKNITLDYLDKIIFKLNCQQSDFINTLSNN